ncbi:NAD(P)/FAD-dependent oxidoreductase [Defluviimonas sp. SAOS-178_SWC]|uniref:NAD(P)/FAD-dependent oxidoreductase n=1 Tax=Defluviimonas sp. SAOS-178_SWC TaxID=3121287 RepID=UPI0032214E9F
MRASADSFDGALWWQSSAEPPVNAPPLQGSAETDIAIIGGGYTGLATALFLAEAGLRPMLLEARHVGFGASGRNGGQVIPGLKYDPDTLIEKFGPDRGAKLVEMAGGAAGLVFDTVARHAIDCAPLRAGWIQAAHSQMALGPVMARARQWQARGVAVEMLDREELAARSGTSAYFGGWRDPRAGSVQPLDYARGLARAARLAGATLHENSPVTALARKGQGWRITVPGGTLQARRVVVATNAHSDDLISGLARSILPVQSMLVATKPMPDDLRARLMPGGVVLSETRKLAFYMRQSADGRLVFGGRGSVGNMESDGLVAALKAGMLRLFPDLADIGFDQQWSGQLALSLDGLPHLHQPEPGLHVALAYNGRGIAMGTAFGRMIADWIATGQAPVFPITPIRPIAWHTIREPVMNLGIRWYWLKDRMGFAS